MQVKMDPCSYKLVFVLCGKRMQVWCKPECPTLLFPLPLPWCARESCKGPTDAQPASERMGTLKQVESAQNGTGFATLQKTIL